jgi:hypothetical protein
MIKNNFNHGDFVNRYKLTDTKLNEYPHKFLPIEFKKFYMQNEKGVIDTYTLGKIGQISSLREARENADYDEDSNFTKRDVEDFYMYAENIMQLFNGETA